MKRIATIIGGLFAFITGMASITPQLSKDLGKIMDGVYSYVPQWGFGLITIALILFLWFINSPKDKQVRNLTPSTTEKYNVESGAVGKQEAKEIKNYFGDSKKKDDKQEIVFPQTYNHQEFFILKATSEQVLNYIRHDMSSSLWYFYTANNFAYDVSYSDSRFCDPNKDNVAVHGAFIHGIKYEIEQRNDEIKNRKNGVHIPDLFWISITSVGIGENVRLQVNFETQDKEAVEFVNVMKKRLVKMFKITDGIAGAWGRSVR